MSDKNSVAEIKNSQVASSGFNYGEYAGTGFEDTKGSDLSIPFINVLQPTSPQIADGLIEDAKIGDMLDSVTGELIKGEKGFTFLPVHKEELWVEWKPRTQGGGLEAQHLPESDVVKNILAKNGGNRIPPKDAEGKRIPFKHNGNEVVQTFYVYGLILNDEGTDVDRFAVISFSSTKVKPYRDWISAMIMMKGKPPIFANRAKFKTVRLKNDSGTYANFVISPLKESWSKSLIDPASEAHLIQEALSYREMVTSGIAKADLNSQREDYTAEGSSTQHRETKTVQGDGEGAAPF